MVGASVVGELQQELQLRADPDKKAWWEGYVKGAAFRGTPMGEVRKAVDAVVRRHSELGERELKALAGELTGDAALQGLTRRLIEGARRNVADRRRFAQTSVGWVLRELSKSRPDEVRAFLAEHGDAMSAEARRAASARL